MDYTTQAQIEAYLKRSLTAAETTLLVGYQAAATSYIDLQTMTNFGIVVATTRYYDGGRETIDIDPCTGITAVTLIDALGAIYYTYDLDQSLETEPVNETVKRWIRSRTGCFGAGIANIAVTAKFSYGAVPNDIAFVATLMIGGMFLEGNDPGSLVSEGIEGYNRTFAVSLANGENSKKKTVIDGILSKYADQEGPLI